MPRPEQPLTQRPGLYHQRVGSVVVTAISDGMFEGSFAMLANFPAAEAEAMHRARFRAIPPRLAVNCFLIQTGNRMILVDAGCGTALGAGLGATVELLRAIEIEPIHIDTVLCTHLHPDHIGGLTNEAGQPVFPDAELIVHRDDHRFWSDEATLADAKTDQDKRFVRLARTTLAAYKNRTRVLTAGEALAGISILPEPGHTPGHSGWLVASGGETLLIWGDIVHMPGIQFARPDAAMGFDVDATRAIETRKRVMDVAATDRLMVAGMHLDFPCFGHVERAEGGFAFVPNVWTPAV